MNSAVQSVCKQCRYLLTPFVMSLGFKLMPLRMSESTIQHSTYHATRILQWWGRQSRTRYIPHNSPLYISEWSLVRLGPAHSRLIANQLMAPLPQLIHSHLQLTHSCLCVPALTVSWVSIHSEIPGRKSAIQSIRRQHLLKPFVVSLGLEPTSLWMSEWAIQFSTQCTTRVFQQRGRQSLTQRIPHDPHRWRQLNATIICTLGHRTWILAQVYQQMCTKCAPNGDLGNLSSGIENGGHWPWPSRSFGHFDSEYQDTLHLYSDLG